MATLFGCLSSRRGSKLPSGSTDLSTRPTIRLFNYDNAVLSLTFGGKRQEPLIVQKRASALLDLNAPPHASSITSSSVTLHVRSLDSDSESGFDLDLAPLAHEEWIQLTPQQASHTSTMHSSDEDSSLDEEKPSEAAPASFWGLQVSCQMRKKSARATG